MDGKILAKDFIEADKIVADLDRIDKKMADILSRMASLASQSNSYTSQAQGNSILRQRVAVENEASIAAKERAGIYRQLLVQQDKINRSDTEEAKKLAELRLENQRLNKEARQEATLNNQKIGAYQKLNLQRTKAAATLRDLVASEKASTKELKAAQKEYDRLNAKVTAADRTVKDYTKNVGNYKSVWGGAISTLRGLVGAFGIVEGLRFGGQLIKDSIELAKEAKGVEFAFKRLGETGTTAFENVRKSTRGMLSDLDIKKSLVDFSNFNISLDESATLFEFLSVRAAQTGKSVDYLKDSLVEGLSKESKLRIDNLGISVLKLNEELERTPNFVSAVANIAKKEIAEAGDILDEAANSTNKWNASWNNLKLSIGNTFSGAVDLEYFAEGLQNSSDLLDAQNAALELGQGLFGTLKAEIRSFTASGREENKRLVEEADRRKEVVKEINAQTRAYIDMYGALGPISKYQSLSGSATNAPFPFNVKDVKESPRLLADINKELEEARNILSEGVFSTREEAKALQDKISLLEKERDAILGNSKAKSNEKTIIEGTIAAYEKEISKLEEYIKYKATTQEAIREARSEIEDFQKAITELTGIKLEPLVIDIKPQVNPSDISGQIKIIKDAFNSLGIDNNIGEDVLGDAGKNAIDGVEKLAKNFEDAEARKTKAMEDEVENRKEILRRSLSTFSEYYGFDAESFVSFVDGKKNTFEDYANAVASINQLVFSSLMEDYAIDRENNKARLDAILNDERSSEEQKAIAKEQYRKEEAKLKKKEFEANKKAALISIAIDTAVGIVKAWANPGYPTAIALSVIIGALGVIQAGVIASKKPPQFFKGTMFAPKGTAVTDEKGAELHTDRHGNIKDFGSEKGARFKWLEAGDRIYTAEQTKKILSSPEEMLRRRIEQGHSTRIEVKKERDDRTWREVAALRADMRKYARRETPINVTVKGNNDYNYYR